MRVIAGDKKGRKLIAPDGLSTRPTSDKVKEALFSIIQFDLPDAEFLDLFSGSGQMGIEALSRGAKYAVFVDSGKKACDCIRQNLAATGLLGCGEVNMRNAQDYLISCRRKFDIVFMDPPYHSKLNEDMLKLFKDSFWVTSDTLIIIEASIDEDMSFIETIGYDIEKEKKYKTNKHVFLYKKNEE